MLWASIIAARCVWFVVVCRAFCLPPSRAPVPAWVRSDALFKRLQTRQTVQGGALFARAEDEQAGAVAQDGKAAPVSDAEVKAVIYRIKAAFAHRAGAALTVAI